MPIIQDDHLIVSIKQNGYDVPFYDDGSGGLYAWRDSLGLRAIVRADYRRDAYEICEDEFFPEADETIEELRKEYGFEVREERVIHSEVSIPEADRPPQLGAYEKFAVYPDDFTDNGKLPIGAFKRWVRIETPNPDAWLEHPEFCEQYGFRPNGPNVHDKIGHGIYAKDLNYDSVDKLTTRDVAALELVIETKPWWDEA